MPLIADRLALRVVASYTDDPGFIDYDYIVREPGVSDPEPDFDDPAAVEANLRRVEDADTEETFSGRVNLAWQATDALDVNLTYYYQDQDVGARTVNHRLAVRHRPLRLRPPLPRAERPAATSCSRSNWRGTSASPI